MLTAWDFAADAPLALPDHEESAALATVRERTRSGGLVCPSCRQPLWLRAGQVVIPHFAHRRLSDCPLGRVSEPILSARRLLYRFFQVRIQSGKLPGEILLEPALAGLPERLRIDLVLQRKDRAAVHVLLLERGLKPDLRGKLQQLLLRKDRVFRPVFLHTRLRESADEPSRFLLDPTQRELRFGSVYDLAQFQAEPWTGSLHFVDPTVPRWVTLRGVTLAHSPQTFAARHCRVSSMDRLLWSETHAEWVHPGEPEALKHPTDTLATERRRAAEAQHRAALARKHRQQIGEARRMAAASAVPLPATGSDPQSGTLDPGVQEGSESATITGMVQRLMTPPDNDAPAPAPAIPPPPPIPPQEPPPPPLPSWITDGLVCVGCGQRTTAWQIAAPEQTACVCRTCFRAGVRLR